MWPAEGVVQMIGRAVPPEVLGMGGDALLRISVFMNVFNVHVNRSPVDATVTALAYRPGKFLNAALDKASIDNERQSLKLKLASGREIAVVQIAGLVARRILCEAREGQQLKAGERLVLIRSEERRVGKECVRTCRARWSPVHLKKKNSVKRQRI